MRNRRAFLHRPASLRSLDDATMHPTIPVANAPQGLPPEDVVIKRCDIKRILAREPLQTSTDTYEIIIAFG